MKMILKDEKWICNAEVAPMSHLVPVFRSSSMSKLPDAD
jgi:hypothetical protein